MQSRSFFGGEGGGGFGYTASRAILIQADMVFFGQNSGIKYSVFPEFWVSGIWNRNHVH